MKKYPTKAGSESKSQKAPSKRAARSTRKRRIKQPLPRIFVETNEPETGQRMRQAHFRNWKGYLILQWREGNTSRSYYLGKARK